jgi:RNA polymerase sigma factor (sigma-70 family)
MAEDARNTEPSFRGSALQHLDGLYAYAMTLVRNQAEAEDLVQETYLRAVQAFVRLRPDSNLKSWLFTILRNLRLNQVRDGLSKSRVVEMDEPDGGTREFEDKSSKDPLFLYLSRPESSPSAHPRASDSSVVLMPAWVFGIKSYVPDVQLVKLNVTA